MTSNNPKPRQWRMIATFPNEENKPFVWQLKDRAIAEIAHGKSIPVIVTEAK